VICDSEYSRTLEKHPHRPRFSPSRQSSKAHAATRSLRVISGGSGTEVK